jgi:hypothetical protein
MPTEHDPGVGKLLAHPPRHSQRLPPLRCEVALQSDDVGPEGLDLGQSTLDAVNAHIHDLADVAMVFQPSRYALQAERLDEK